jgi:hypothetical protein
MRSRLVVLSGVILLCVSGLPLAASGATPQIAGTADAVAGLRNVTVNDGQVAGEVVNHSKTTLRDVQLRILYSWRWKNEFRPGKDDPGTAVFMTVDKEIPAGQSARFEYKPSPPPARKDGHFDVSAKIVGFTQIYR